MARNTLEAWIPEEYDSAVIQRVTASSAVEKVASHTPMKSDTKHIPRSAGVGVDYIPKGGAYGEDVSANDEVLLTARKLGKAIRIAEEDIDDSLADVLSQKGIDWATSYGKFFDNATLGVTAAENGTTVPFTSVYKALATANAATGYVANDNITQTAALGVVTYDFLSATLADLEAGDYFDPSRVVVIAHPAFRSGLRGVKDTAGNPIFVQGLAGTPDSIFGAQIEWSTGARTSALPSSAPTGNPLMIFANPDFLNVGDRSNAESMFIDGDTGIGALTDEAILKYRARKGFVIGHEKAVAILEKMP